MKTNKPEPCPAHEVSSCVAGNVIDPSLCRWCGGEVPRTYSVHDGDKVTAARIGAALVPAAVATAGAGGRASIYDARNGALVVSRLDGAPETLAALPALLAQYEETLCAPEDEGTPNDPAWDEDDEGPYVVWELGPDGARDRVIRSHVNLQMAIRGYEGDVLIIDTRTGRPLCFVEAGLELGCGCPACEPGAWEDHPALSPVN